MSKQDVGSVEGLGLADAIALLRDELLTGARRWWQVGDTAPG